MQEKIKTSTFFENELSFYQVCKLFIKFNLGFAIEFKNFNKKGVANTFAKSYANIIFKNRLIKTCMDAIEWLNQRYSSEVILKALIH